MGRRRGRGAPEAQRCSGQRRGVVRGRHYREEDQDGHRDPDLDVAAQKRPLTYLDEDDEELPDPMQVPLEADPADVADQHHVAPVIEEDDPFN
jgi:hypothetical protein